MVVMVGILACSRGRKGQVGRGANGGIGLGVGGEHWLLAAQLGGLVEGLENGCSIRTEDAEGEGGHAHGQHPRALRKRDPLTTAQR